MVSSFRAWTALNTKGTSFVGTKGSALTRGKGSWMMKSGDTMVS